MAIGGARIRAAVRFLTCACLLLAFTGLAAAPLAVLLPGQMTVIAAASMRKINSAAAVARHAGPGPRLSPWQVAPAIAAARPRSH